MTTQFNTSINIPLTKLILWESNVRKTRPETSIAELSATIASYGLVHPLIVKAEPRGKYAVVAGGRRFRALQRLVMNGEITKNTLVPCTLLDRETNPTEISLVENVHREAMHPADEFEAFKTLIDGGMPRRMSRRGSA